MRTEKGKVERVEHSERGPLVPETFAVPESLETPHFKIRKLTVADAELDYEAVMSSVDLIRRVRGGEWPTPALTLEGNKADLRQYEREFKHRESFVYTVTSLDGKECLGCLYLNPPGRRGETTKNADVDVSFWVSQSAYEKGLFSVLHTTINEWLTKWPFKKITFSNAELPE